jgi:thiol-disulfide isomerase/thioredoxin
MHPQGTWKHSALVAVMLAASVMTARAAALTHENRPATVAGLWNATVTVNGVDVPFRFEIAGGGKAVRGSFFDGDRRITSTTGAIDGDVVTLRFEQYATTLEATLRGDALEGTYLRGSRPPYAFKATRFVSAAKPASEAPTIAGLWTIGVDSAKGKGEKAWRFIVRQKGPEVSASILRIDGDTGTLTGGWRDGAFVLSHFSGARPTLIEVTPTADGALKIVQNRKAEYVAVRAEDPKAAALGEPTDPARHTRVKDAAEPFRFSFPDLDGRTVANTDARFAGKVVLVSITGSWCPNCHDEAPFLASLYKKYKGQGLEIVALSFEESDQLANPTRLRNFIAQYGIGYTVLLPGVPDDLNAKVPQAENLNSFPTTFFLGRDGGVRGVHAGFPSPASGSFYTQAAREVTEQVERLLAERAPGTY